MCLSVLFVLMGKIIHFNLKVEPVDLSKHPNEAVAVKTPSGKIIQIVRRLPYDIFIAHYEKNNIFLA